MKYFFLAFSLILTATPVSADWYIFNKDNQCIGKVQYKPDAKDLESREEFSFYSEKDMSIKKLEYFNNDIRETPKTSEDRESDRISKEIKEEQELIRNRADKEAYDALKAEGVTFKHINESLFKKSEKAKN